MDRIALRGIRAYGRHGWESAERASLAPFDVDVEVDVDLRAAQTSDDLADTIDYARLHRRIVTLVERESFALLERLAAEICGILFEEPRIARAVVSVAKPQKLAGATPSVTLDRQNPSYRAE